MLITFARQFWWVLLFMFAAGLIKLFAPNIKGKTGEGLVNLAAKLRLDRTVYHLIKDVTIPTKRGTTQVDHIIVSKFGLFVIETKNYKGWIFADAKSAKWTQVHFKQKHQFQNPLRQNYAHICALPRQIFLWRSMSMLWRSLLPRRLCEEFIFQ
jgi:restriction system protein